MEFTITEEDIADIFTDLYDDQFSGRIKCPDGPYEERIEWMIEKFVEKAKVIVSIKEEWGI